MYAIIETGGKQYKVCKDDVIYIEKLEAESEQAITFDKVVAAHNGTELIVGSPYVANATVKATVEKNGRKKKIIVFKYKAKKGYRRRQGHRQPYTKVVINDICI